MTEPDSATPFGFKNTTEFVVWLSAERIDIAVKALDAAHANLVKEATAAETERCASWFDEMDCLLTAAQVAAAIRAHAEEPKP